jgi:hypothetical protein
MNVVLDRGNLVDKNRIYLPRWWLWDEISPQSYFE